MYRRNMYSLRRLILTGDHQQRRQVLHLFTQQWVDQAVSRFIDPVKHPREWMAETLDAATALAAPAAAAAPGGRGRRQVPSAGSTAGQQQKVSPLAALMWHINQLVNPDSAVDQMAVEFKTVVDGVAYDSTAATLQQLQAASSSNGTTSSSSSSNVRVPVNLVKVDVLTAEQLTQLAAYLMQDAPLPWPAPSFPPSFKTQLALLTHARLFDTPLVHQQQQQASGNNPNTTTSSSSGGSLQQLLPELAVAQQRPALHGPYSDKVSVLRNYLGTVVILAYEARQLGLSKLIVAAGNNAQGPGGGAASPAGLLDLDGDLYLTSYVQGVMLDWVDALWSCFLEVRD
jgi:hypothetical protein